MPCLLLPAPDRRCRRQWRPPGSFPLTRSPTGERRRPVSGGANRHRPSGRRRRLPRHGAPPGARPLPADALCRFRPPCTGSGSPPRRRAAAPPCREHGRSARLSRGSGCRRRAGTGPPNQAVPRRLNRRETRCAGRPPPRRRGPPTRPEAPPAISRRQRRPLRGHAGRRHRGRLDSGPGRPVTRLPPLRPGTLAAPRSVAPVRAYALPGSPAGRPATRSRRRRRDRGLRRTG